MRALVFMVILLLAQYTDVSLSLEATLFLGSWAVVLDVFYLVARWIEVRT